MPRKKPVKKTVPPDPTVVPSHQDKFALCFPPTEPPIPLWQGDWWKGDWRTSQRGLSPLPTLAHYAAWLLDRIEHLVKIQRVSPTREMTEPAKLVSNAHVWLGHLAGPVPINKSDWTTAEAEQELRQLWAWAKNKLAAANPATQPTTTSKGDNVTFSSSAPEQTATSPTTPPVIWFHAKQSYSMDGITQLCVTPEVHNLFQVFLK